MALNTFFIRQLDPLLLLLYIKFFAIIRRYPVTLLQLCNIPATYYLYEISA